MKYCEKTRREFLQTGMGMTAGVFAGSCGSGQEKPVVSIARIVNGNTGKAVEQAIDLLGGIRNVTKGKDRIMLKPNLVDARREDTTKPEVVGALARLMKNAGKEVLIGEGSAGATGFNMISGVMYRTTRRDILDPMQQFIFDELGYTDLSKSLKIPLVNLHSGDMAEVDISSGYVFDSVAVHRSLTDIDMLCSVPMMKTHVLATVTLGMKNLIGVYPGVRYYSFRAWLHDRSAEKGSIGIAGEIVDMVRANRLGLTVIDGSTAMEGQGPSIGFGGTLVDTNVIIAGTNPLATDMVAAVVMGFDPDDIPTFTWAQKAGMTPYTVEEIEIRGETIAAVRLEFVKPKVVPWDSVKDSWGVEVL